MKANTSAMPMRPASRVWVRNWLPRVALIVCSTADDRERQRAELQDGHEVVRVRGGEAGEPAAVIWTLPSGIAFWMTGAEMTAPSRTIAK